MIWVALAISAYAFYELFSADSGLKLAFALVRLSLSIMIIVSLRFPHGLILMASGLLVVLSMIAAMAVMRKEVQLRNDQR